MDAPVSEALQWLQGYSPATADDPLIRADTNGVEIELPSSGLRFHHSFISGPMAARAAQSTQLLLKACNNKQRNIDTILDVTAGWGVDSYILARHGQRVTMLEQNRLVSSIVDYSIELLADDPATADMASRMKILNTDAVSYLQRPGNDDEYDCIYLDPMFGTHKSGAKPAKEMQVLQVITANMNMDDCFQLALQNARKRVVVKRAAKAPRLNSLKPDLVQRARSVRFDIYLTA